ncbi:MAG: glycoside hydrolase family 13 protein [Clostridia bacterium]|nr:glycoside hydrolase family 13 protein [Clostridia bacterium]
MQLFSSRDIHYRNPFGAVKQGTEILFRICLPRDWGCRGAWLIHRSDSGLDRWDGMFWAGMEGDDREWWDCRYTPNTADLYWYYFAIDTDEGRRYLSRLPDGSADIATAPGNSWQLTCYGTDLTTPDWLAGGVFYQIFPDRFCCSGKPKEGVPADRVMHDRWGEQPCWQPDEAGVVRNNDFFGGDLEGIRSKLPYLKQLGVTCVYLNPIFESHSNHRYDTADYSRIDPLLGTVEELRQLTDSARGFGIRVILDGVFSHTGADSLYFNKNGRYPAAGAYQTQESPYAPWYHFTQWPQNYIGWWGFNTLPEVNELEPSFITYITGENGIVRKWLRTGASGWRLDVADELPDGFLEALRRAVKSTDPEALVLGEVWEDASNKQSYNHRRRYLLGKQLDSVMNYPFRTAVLEFIKNGNGEHFFNQIQTVVENYPPSITRLLMNSLGTHDTERAITMLAGEPASGRGRRWQSETRLSKEQHIEGVRRLKAAAVLQYCLPGVPCLYYGDETGLEGYRDPFNRGCYPWGREDRALVDWFCQLGRIRAEQGVFREGAFVPVYAAQDAVVFDRIDETGTVRCAVNRSVKELHVPLDGGWETAVGAASFYRDYLCLPPMSGSILVKG